MIIVALVLIVLCAVVILGALFGEPTGPVTLNFFDVWSLEVTSREAFFEGVATGAVSMLALWLLLVSLRRARQKSAERRAMEKRHEELEKEKADLEKKLGRDRTPDLTDPTAAPDRDETYGLSTQPGQDPDPR